ncbi:MAG: glycosyltransferase family 2 protein [Novosphingobium sp.]
MAETETRIAVLVTCHNRRELTLRCLRTLADQAHFREDDLFLVDDGSTDGTGDAVRALMPGAHVISGDGSLFWNGGMRLAWESALASGQTYDFFLWLNDDVEILPGALAMMVRDADAVVPRGGPVIVAAATHDRDTGELTYGAHRRPHPGRPLRMGLVAPTGKPERVDTISGNIALISGSSVGSIGIISPAFRHIYGDLDYGLRAVAAGIPVLLASQPGGYCGGNPVAGTSVDAALPKLNRLKKRWKEAGRIHGVDWRRFVALHGGGPLVQLGHRVMPYLRILLDKPHRHAAGDAAKP